MSQAQFLLFLIAVVPIVNCLMINLCSESQKLVNIFSKFLPVLFLMPLIGMLNSANHNEVNLELVEAMRGVSIALMLNDISLKFLFLLDFVWVIFAFYSHRFLRLEENKNINQFKLFFAIAVALLNLIVIAQNLVTTLFFYNCLVIFCHFFAVKFLHKKETKFSYLFTFSLYLESILLFLAIVATYKFTGRLDFNSDGILSGNIAQAKIFILFALYLGGLFLSMLVPLYLLHRDSNFNPLIIYILFFFAYAFSSLYIFIKVLVFIFGTKTFGDLVLKIGFHYFELILLANFLISSALLLLSKNLKSSFFYLFFNQFTFALFSIFTFAIFDNSRIYLPLFSFLLSITLVFLCLSNVVLYCEKAENKSFNGLFYDLKITSVLLIFALLNLIGLAPSIGVLEKFFLIKIIFKSGSTLASIMLFANFFVMILFTSRLLYAFLFKVESKKSEFDLDLAKNIDFDSSLILTALVTAVVVFLGLIFFPLLTNFFNI